MDTSTPNPTQDHIQWHTRIQGIIELQVPLVVRISDTPADLVED